MTSPAVIAASLSTGTVVILGWWLSWHLAPPRSQASGTEAGPTDRDSRPHVGRLTRPLLARRRADAVDETTLAHWCRELVRRLRTGTSLPAAFDAACDAVPSVGRRYEDVVRARQRGASLAGALGRHVDADEATALVTATLRTCARLGGPAAEPVDRTASTLHARAAARAERRAHSAQAELSAKLLTVLPLAVLALLLATDDGVRASLGNPLVRVCLVLGVVLNVAGWWWMRRIIAGPPRRSLLARRRPAAAAARALPEGIEILVACLHAGLTPPQLVDGAIDDLPEPLRPPFTAVQARMRRGQRFADAVDELPVLIGPQAHGLADSMAAADRYGLPLGPVLDRLAGEAAEARRRRGEADARRLPVRLSFPLVAATLPSFVLIALAPAVIGAVSSLTEPSA